MTVCGRQSAKQPVFWSHIYIYIYIYIHMDGTKHLTLLRIRAQGKNFKVRELITSKKILKSKEWRQAISSFWHVVLILHSRWRYTLLHVGKRVQYLFKPKFVLFHSKMNCAGPDEAVLNTSKALWFYTSSNMAVSGNSAVDLLVILFFNQGTFSAKIASFGPSTSWVGRNGSQLLVVYSVLGKIFG